MIHQITLEFGSQAVSDSLNQRLLEHINSFNIVNNIQLDWFSTQKSNSRSCCYIESSLNKIYVHHHNEKIYVCFVEILFKLLHVNVGAWLFNLIKSLFSNSTCSIEEKSNTALSIRKRGTPGLYFEPATIQPLC